MRRIRPSALNLARHCLHASLLAERHPESSAAAINGRGWHAHIASNRDLAKALIEEALGEPVADFDLEYELPSARGGGTLDIGGRTKTGAVFVADWKTGSATEPAESNRQIAAYLSGYSTARADGGIAAIVYLEVRDWKLCVGRVDKTYFSVADLEKLAAERADLEAIATDKDDPTPGSHCQGCFQSHLCHALTRPLGLISGADSVTLQNIGQVRASIAAAEKGAERARLAVSSFVASHGGRCEDDAHVYEIRSVAGRETFDAKAFKAANPLDYEAFVKRGSPSQRLVATKKGKSFDADDSGGEA